MNGNRSHLSIDERRQIEQWKAAKVSVDEIADRLKRHRSTIFREIKRNQFQDAALPKVGGYFSLVAQMKYASLRLRGQKLMRHLELQAMVIDRIKAGWTLFSLHYRLSAT